MTFFRAWTHGLLTPVLVLASCQAPAHDPVAADETSGETSESDSDGEASDGEASDESTGEAESGDHEPTPASPGCRPLDPQISTDPRTIEAAVALINALPKPLSLACFVESLDRPLRINATSSNFSAQPAVGERSPRLFLMRDPLVLSIALEGSGSTLLEFGEFVSETQSLKGELEFPIQDTVAPAAPFDHVVFQEDRSTRCGFCHTIEQPYEAIPGAFVSNAFRPAYWTVVELSSVELEWQMCDPDVEPARCSLLDSVFSRGAVEHEAFPEDLAAFFE